MHVWVKVVMLVRMIRTRLPTAVRAKSCPGVYNNWAMASSSNPSALVLL